MSERWIALPMAAFGGSTHTERCRVVRAVVSRDLGRQWAETEPVAISVIIIEAKRSARQKHSSVGMPMVLALVLDAVVGPVVARAEQVDAVSGRKRWAEDGETAMVLIRISDV